MKKILFILFNLLLLAYMVFALSFSNMRETEMLCTEVKINMKDTLTAGFLNRGDIERILLHKQSEILGYPIAGINTRKLEEKLIRLAYVKDADIFWSLDGIMYVDILQRSPVLRVITRKQNTYYLDEEGYIFPAASGFTPHVIIANGYFSDDEQLREVERIENLKGNEDYTEWIEVLKLANFIIQDDFWESQIVQIYRNSKGDFELIPRVGAHQIILGDGSELEVKFKKLKTLYNEGLKYEGWNKYEKINLKYNNQVICTKR